MKFITIIADTFRECLGKKILLIFFGLSTFAIISLIFIINVDIKESYAAISAFFGHQTDTVSLTVLKEGVLKLEAVFATALYTAGIFLSLFATADIIPSMMAKGRIELYLARPVSRASILLGKYVGAALVIAINIVYVFTGIWIVLGIKTGIWNFNFFYAVAAIIFMSSAFYTFMIFISVLSKNTAVTIIVTYFMIVLTPMLAQREALKFISNSVFMYFLDVLYWIVPKYVEVAVITKDLVQGNHIQSWTPVAGSLLTAIIVMNGAVYIFSKKDL